MIDLQTNCLLESIDVKLKITNELELSSNNCNSFCSSPTEVENNINKNNQILIEEFDLVQKISNRNYKSFFLFYFILK